MRILLVEDNPADVRLVQEALRDGKIVNEVDVVGDGVEALAFLRRQGPYEDAESPAIVLLDLNLPRKDGRAVLREMRQDDSLRHIPVIILSMSTDEDDIRESYEQFVNCYVVKPTEYKAFVKVIRSLDDFWFQIVHLPPANH